MNGFLNVNKPYGITSYDVIRILKPHLARTKIGHLGTLDPMASGVLPIALGTGTRLIPYIEDNRKAYEAEMILGGVANTQDATGEIIETPCERVQPEEIEAIFARFRGEIDQVPPMFSAVHHDGRRLYELAREGMKVELQPRRVTIYKLELREYDTNAPIMRVRFFVECSSGTYVRTICHDVGQALGCGAYLSSLVRTRSGPFYIENAIELSDIHSRDDLLRWFLPLDYPLTSLPLLVVDEVQTYDIGHGRAVLHPEVRGGQRYRLHDSGGNLLAIARGEENPGRVCPEKVFIGGRI